MREATLQSKVAKELRAQKRIEGEDVPDALWDYLVRKRYVEDARAKDFDEDAVQFLVDEILEINEAKLSPQGSRKGAGREAGSKETEVRATLSSNIAKRAEVFEKIATMLAADYPDVKSFRKDVLDGQLLTHEQAGELLDEQGGPEGNGSILEALRKLGKRLSKAYRWDALDAMWFVLTGYSPSVLPVHTVVSTTHSGDDLHPNTATVTLVVEPWVGANEVARVYASVRDQLLNGGNYRVRSERNLEVLRFIVQKRTEIGGDRPLDYETLRKLWNRENPSQRMEYNRFWEAATRTEQAVLKPRYEIPEHVYELSPAKSWRARYCRRETAAVANRAKSIGHRSW